MLEGIILGTIQGIAEWLPISSEAVVILVKSKFFGGGSLTELIKFSLFLHLGTFLAAAWYLREDVIALTKMLFRPFRLFREKGEVERMFRFLFVATILSGALGYVLIELVLPLVEQYITASARVITLGIGVLLLGTAFLQWQAQRKRSSHKNIVDLSDRDGVLLGIIQGFSALPGLSRSGLTISTLLLRNYNDTTALRISFLMSLPVVLGSNIFLAAKNGMALNMSMIFGFVFAFLFGFLSIHLLFRIARRLNFAYFVFLFGVLTIVSAFVP